MQAKELARLLKGKEQPCIIDVRSGFEYKTGHIPGAVHAPGWKILFRLAKLPREKEALLVVTCEHGPRAQLARTLLGSRGYRRVELLDGHMSGWRRANLPLEK
ncbi:sulfurtransferase [Geotalea uraniireducens]|uniref:Sulfurtransferase n=1 Tax=Geotalea uraniireducens TaxID=351604 RepID=A0ABM8EJS8_9BACT|nr:rhodanese-like domain-containing protein [Geotalea uraniireducens]BDV42789.1 sulfurtransferase [Geotalea uraniireducens]